jgi:hypothetical protein
VTAIKWHLNFDCYENFEIRIPMHWFSELNATPFVKLWLSVVMSAQVSTGQVTDNTSWNIRKVRTWHKTWRQVTSNEGLSGHPHTDWGGSCWVILDLSGLCYVKVGYVRSGLFYLGHVWIGTEYFITCQDKFALVWDILQQVLIGLDWLSWVKSGLVRSC